MIHKRWQRGRLTVGWHAYRDVPMTTKRRRLVIQPFLLWWLR